MPETPPRNTLRVLMTLSQYNDYKRLTKYPLDTAFSEKKYFCSLINSHTKAQSHEEQKALRSKTQGRALHTAADPSYRRESPCRSRQKPPAVTPRNRRGHGRPDRERHKTESNLGRRHHLHPNQRRLALSGRDFGYVFPQGHGVEHPRLAGHGSREMRLEESMEKTPPRTRTKAPLGSRMPVCEQGVPKPAGRAQSRGLNELQRQLLRQRGDGKFLGHAEK